MDTFDLVSKERVDTLRPACRKQLGGEHVAAVGLLDLEHVAGDGRALDRGVRHVEVVHHAHHRLREAVARAPRRELPVQLLLAAVEAWAAASSPDQLAWRAACAVKHSADALWLKGVREGSRPVARKARSDSVVFTGLPVDDGPKLLKTMVIQMVKKLPGSQHSTTCRPGTTDAGPCRHWPTRRWTPEQVAARKTAARTN